MFAQHAIACVLCELLLELFLVFFQTLKRFLTSFSILFNFQGPVAPQPFGWRPVYCTTEVVFCQALFFRSCWTFWTWNAQEVSQNKLELFQRLLVLFKGFLLWLRKSFFCLSAWRSSIIPHTGPLVNTFLLLFSSFFAFIWNVLTEMSPRAFSQWNALRRGSIFSRKKTAHAMHRRSFAYITL